MELDPQKIIRKDIGDGMDTSFWKDRWLDEKNLQEKFPRLFILEASKNCCIKDRITPRGLEWNWVREIREGRTKEELNVLTSMLKDIYLSNKADMWRCQGGPKGEFSVRWFRGEIEKKSSQSIGKNRWLKWIPNKVNIFIWKLFRKRITVKEVLKAMGLVQPSLNCDVCKLLTESILHAFFECKVAADVWSKVYSWWGI